MTIQDPLEYGVIGPFLLGLDIQHCLSATDQIVELGFVPECFKSRVCRIVWSKIREWHIKNEFTSEKLVSFCNSLEDISDNASERYLWVVDTARQGSALGLVSNAVELVERHLKEMTMQAIGSVSKGTSEEILSYLETKISDIRNRLVAGNRDEKAEACEQLSDELEAISKGERNLKSSMVPAWDQCLGGLPEAQLIVLAGRPGGGKTSLAEQIIDEAVRSGTSTLYIQRELSRTRAIGRLAARKASVAWSKVEMRKVSEQELSRLRASVEDYKSLPLFLAPVSNCNNETIKSLVRHHYRQNKIKLVVMDYVQLVDVPRGMEKRIAIGDVTRALKDSSTETGVTVIAIAQLSRDSERRNEKPSLSDLKESGDIEQFADVALALWTSKEREDAARWPINWSVLKNRNGPLGTTEVMFDGPSMSFLGKTITTPSGLQERPF